MRNVEFKFCSNLFMLVQKKLFSWSVNTFKEVKSFNQKNAYEVENECVWRHEPVFDIPISMHFCRRHAGHELRFPGIIGHFPWALHLYSVFLRRLRRKNAYKTIPYNTADRQLPVSGMAKQQVVMWPGDKQQKHTHILQESDDHFWKNITCKWINAVM